MPAQSGPAPGELPAGLMLGKYQIVRQLGSGGMGAVYEAIHTSIGKSVALKTMNPALASDPRAEARFMREAAAASRLGHPNVCDVTDFGSDAGIVYIVMELMRGEDLSALVSHAPAGLDITFVADVMLAVCAGVFAAHEKGVVHRDLKPQNIFLSRTAMGDVVPKVLDFGISKLLDEEAAGALTHSGSVMGTTHYLSPEQVMGLPVDGRSDEFALGVILFECLTGKRPHAGDTIFTIMRAISEGRFQRPRSLRPDLAPEFEAIILRALALRPDDRFPTVHALGNALLGFASAKGRVMWVDYFSRPPAGMGGFGAPATGPNGQFLVTPDGRSGPIGPGPTMMMGHAQVGSDTRSGVGPVSVWGTGEIEQAALPRRGRGPLFAVGGVAVAALAFFIIKPSALPRQDADEVAKRAEVTRSEGDLRDKQPAAKGFGAAAGFEGNSRAGDSPFGDPAVANPRTEPALQQKLEQRALAEPPALDRGSTAARVDGVDGIAGTAARKDRRSAAGIARAKAASRVGAPARDGLPGRSPVTKRPVPVRSKNAAPARPPAKPPGDDPDTVDSLGGTPSKARPNSVPILD